MEVLIPRSNSYIQPSQRIGGIGLTEAEHHILGVTGTPGTGKKGVGAIVAEMLGYDFIDLNKAAFDSRAVLEGDEEGFTVDPDILRRYVRRVIKGRSMVVAGHLLPSILSKGEVEFVAVLRCDPTELERRYVARNYSLEKLKTNISAEMLDVCLTEAIARFGVEAVAEFDTTGRTPEDVADEIINVYRGLKPRSLGRVRWLEASSVMRLIDRYLR